jgi:hypothetical protein
MDDDKQFTYAFVAWLSLGAIVLVLQMWAVVIIFLIAMFGTVQ